MSVQELKEIYETVDEMSLDEKQQLIAYLEESRQPRSIIDVVTQEELDLIYAATLGDPLK
ncbi:hypothetical protein [Vibrio sp. LaRot3]|uniref:hypothetical protein n=1 Tax=Vibrio sp. LaRot3 TaxID=2998829 RepID=UPI0022CE3634|nr:hypothetical protein [Vibrio sp. LaRot3]MDA0148143.1 hypothetical protein [Vibrio sp. LaRot3]